MPLQTDSSITGDFKLDVLPHSDGEDSAMAEIPNDAPHNIIKKDKPYHVHVQLDLAGSSVTLLTGHQISYEVVLESIGSGFEGVVATKTITFGAMTDPFTVDEWLECGSPDSDGVGTGIYKLMVAATITTSTGTPLGMIGFGEGPFVQVYEPALTP